MKEYRVLWYEIRGTFTCYPTLEGAQTRVAEERKKRSYPLSDCKIQHRKAGTQGDDSTWTDCAEQVAA